MEAHPEDSRSDRSTSGTDRGRGSGWTTDARFIRRWIEERGGFPATARGTGAGDAAGRLRIDVPGLPGEEQLERIGWGEFFDLFERADLAFVYRDESASGDGSGFPKLVARDQVAGRAGSRSSRGPVGEA